MKLDLIEATNYQDQSYLITRYTDLTQRGMNLKWDGNLPSSKAVEEWADDYSSASKLEWDSNIRVTSVTDLEGNVTEYYSKELYMSYIDLNTLTKAS